MQERSTQTRLNKHTKRDMTTVRIASAVQRCKNRRLIVAEPKELTEIVKLSEGEN